jgi:hypothetical protein
MIHIEQLPNEYFTSMDDAEVKLLALQLGVLDRIQVNGPLPGSMFYEFTTHPRHWILIVLHAGHRNPDDNGYTFQSWPKSAMTKAEYDLACSDYREGIGMHHQQRKNFLPPGRPQS